MKSEVLRERHFDVEGSGINTLRVEGGKSPLRNSAYNILMAFCIRTMQQAKFPAS